MKSSDSIPEKGIEALARMGYVAKGTVYLVVGLLAAVGAFGLGGRATGTRGALHELAVQPFGRGLLMLMVVGLAGYVVWRFTQGFADAEGKGRGLAALGARAGFVLSGVVYLGLAVYAVDLLVRVGFGGGGSVQDRTAMLMSWTGGVWLVGGIGLGIIGVGLYQAWRAYTDAFKRSWDMPGMSPPQRLVVSLLGRIGLSTRAVFFVMVGVFLIIAAVQFDPSEARGLGGALSSLASQPFGPWLLLVSGLGLGCYGLYCFVNARYRDIDP